MFKRLFAFSLLLLTAQLAHAVNHNVRLPHSSNDGEHSYINEVQALREALSEQTATDAHLRVTRDDDQHSVVTFINLDGTNNETTRVDLIVRNRDLYVLGFVNGSGNNRVLYRFDDYDDLTLANVRTENLGFRSSYPSIEQMARISRYSNNLDISIEGLREAVWRLSDYAGRPNGRPALAQALLRILVAYFEGMRFEEIAQSIEYGLNSRAGEWIADNNAAVLTNSWAHLSGFYLGAISRNNRDVTYDLTFRSDQLAQQNRASAISDERLRTFTASLTPRRGSTPIVMALGLLLRSSCPNLVTPRKKRQAEDACSGVDYCIPEFGRYAQSTINPPLCTPPADAYVALGNKYFDRERGQALLSLLLD